MGGTAFLCGTSALCISPQLSAILSVANSLTDAGELLPVPSLGPLCPKDLIPSTLDPEVQMHTKRVPSTDAACGMTFSYKGLRRGQGTKHTSNYARIAADKHGSTPSPKSPQPRRVYHQDHNVIKVPRHDVKRPRTHRSWRSKTSSVIIMVEKTEKGTRVTIL